MSNILFQYSKLSLVPLYRAKLELDLDPQAERFSILDRKTMATLYTGKADRSVIHLNNNFTSGGNLVVMIFDDDRTFNAAVVDGVDGQIFDVANT
ncbi:hypothetical protein ABIS04_16190 [Shewanella sp. H8]|uniref:hypothetical protein n=1 Tax=Shewanella sp. H8 TaxID=3342676 RepID=UPI00331542BD